MWRAITVEDVQGRMSGKEVTALQNKFVADGQSDPIVATIATIVDEVRGYIDSNNTYVMGPDGTIPSRLVNAAVDIIRFQLLTRIPDAGLMTDDRRKGRDDAYALLQKVADGKWGIGEALLSDDQIAGVPQISSPERRFTRDTEDGI